MAHNLEGRPVNPRNVIVVLASVVMIVGATALACARDGGPSIVIPGRPDVPVIINGHDARWAVVYGDTGLNRPGADVIVQGSGLNYPQPIYPQVVLPQPWAGSYYPVTGQPPAYGRKEIEPPLRRRLPEPAPTYYRSWSAGSDPGPVTEYPSFDPPAVVVAPRRRPAR
jgi:hypothetical protein